MHKQDQGIDSIFRQIVSQFLKANRRVKQGIVVLSDLVMLFIACWMALALRLGDIVEPMQRYWLPCVLVPLISVPVMARLGLYRAVIRYMGHVTLWVSFKAVFLSVLIWGAVLVVLEVPAPRSVFFIYGFTAVTLVAGSRLYARWLIRRLSPSGQRLTRAEPVAVYGAGSAGAQLVAALSDSAEFQAVAFLDDDLQKQGTEISGLRVYSPDSLSSLIEQYGVKSVLLALPGLARSERRVLVEKISVFPVSVKVLPGISQLASGSVRVSDIRDVDVTDLLGRDPAEPVAELMTACITDKVVMVTGAGGSIGAEICRQVLGQKPKRLVLFELSEFALYQLEQELNALPDAGVQIVPVLGSVLDQGHLESILRTFQVNTLYHAAAYKHVPMVESNIASGLRNNVLGTLRTAQAAIAAHVSDFVLVSTDKAVRPTNVMGASKRLAEMVLQALSEHRRFSRESTRFVMVRFGNVLGSSGSVIPLFRQQIEQGGPLTVTHPDINRYFMTIPEASALVIQAGSMGEGGDVFVLDMGQPVRIVDLAKEMIRLAGLSLRDATDPNGDIEIRYTGLRPGEKLYEELLIGESVSGTRHPMIMRACENMLAWELLQPRLQELELLTRSGKSEALVSLLQQLVDGYQPSVQVIEAPTMEPHRLH
jgi:FlaA1/EpsC-like NDP-sugar epimerase